MVLISHNKSSPQNSTIQSYFFNFFFKTSGKNQQISKYYGLFLFNDEFVYVSGLCKIFKSLNFFQNNLCTSKLWIIVFISMFIMLFMLISIQLEVQYQWQYMKDILVKGCFSDQPDFAMNVLVLPFIKLLAKTKFL